MQIPGDRQSPRICLQEPVATPKQRYTQDIHVANRQTSNFKIGDGCVANKDNVQRYTEDILVANRQTSIF